MLLQSWLTNLQSADAGKRLDAALILGTLDEAEALDAVAAQYRAESDAKVKAALGWAGKRLHAARQAGYKTIDAIFQHFRIEEEIHPPQMGSDEQELMRKLQFQMDMDALRHQESTAGKQVVNRMAGGMMFGLPGLMMGSMSNHTSLEVRSLEQVNQKPRRTPPTRPADTDITMLLRRLSVETEWEKRARAASDLAVIINNPQAIPNLAKAFVQDRSEQVREAAQSAAKLLYWNHIYWHMDQDGTLSAEINWRLGRMPVEPVAAVPVEADDWQELLQEEPAIQPEPRRSLIHADKSAAKVEKKSALDLDDEDFLATEYVEKRRPKPAPKPQKKNNGGLMLLILLGAMVVLVCGGLAVIALEGMRAVEAVVTNPELLSAVNMLSATPEGYGSLPANLNRRGTLETFQPVQAVVRVEQDDAWTFSANEGDELSFVTIVSEENLPPRLFLYDPEGHLLVARADEISVAFNAPLTIIMPNSGRYTLVVGAPFVDTEYELTMQFVPDLSG
jgi:hypothetical protein